MKTQVLRHGEVMYQFKVRCRVCRRGFMSAYPDEAYDWMMSHEDKCNWKHGEDSSPSCALCHLTWDNHWMNTAWMGCSFAKDRD